MSITETFMKETMIGNKRGKIYRLTSDGSATSEAITPGAGFTVLLGNYTKYTESSGVFTITFAAGTNLSYRYFLFIAP